MGDVAGIEPALFSELLILRSVVACDDDSPNFPFDLEDTIIFPGHLLTIRVIAEPAINPIKEHHNAQMD